MTKSSQIPSKSSLVLSIIIPCFNEEGTLRSLEKRLRESLSQSGTSYEIIFIDDASDDSSVEILKDLSENNPRVKVLRNQNNCGIFASWMMGIEKSEGEYVCLIDSDLQNPPEDVLRLLNSIKATNYSVAQAVRSDFERKKGLRFIYSRSLNWLLNLLFQDRASDNKSGFIVAESSVLENALSKIEAGGFRFPQTFIRVALIREQVSILEVESLFMPRLSGESFLSGFASIKASFQILARDIPLGLWVFRPSNYRPSYGLIPKDMLHKNGLASLKLSPIRRLLFEIYFLTMPLHKWIIRRSSRRFYIELLESQYFSASQLSQLQLQRLRILLEHAYRNVPYYRQVFDRAGFNPAKLHTLNDLEQIPLLSKDDVRKNLYFDLFSKNSKKTNLLKISTSGSTGEPFAVYADRFQLEVRFATTLRQLHWTGWRFGDRQLRLWHQRIGMNATQVVKEKIDAMFMRRKFIPAFEISESNISRFIRDIERTKPVLMDGYAESLNFLASYLGSRNLASRPRAIMSSAQILPEQSRKIIEQALGTRVFDKYGSREFSGIAYECAERPGYHHVMEESYILEILVDGRSAKPGEVGEIVITDLNNFSVPLIRYRIGDLAECVENELCECGRSLKLIGKIQGRTQAIVYCADGVWMPGTFFAHFFKDYDSVIAQFQIYQAVKNEFEVRFIRGTDFSQQRLNVVIQELRKHVGNTKINLNEVEEIPLLITGKRSPVVSEIKSDFQKI